MICVSNFKLWTCLVIFFSVVVHCKFIYRWEKAKILPQIGQANWRATSLALTESKIFFTLVDLNKQNSGNGLVVSFDRSSSISPKVTIFPFASLYKLRDPLRGKVITPISVRVDQCERLWLLDAAVQNISGIQTKTMPGIHVINTSDGEIIRSFEIPSSQWTSSSFFVNFAIDTESVDTECKESFGYFADFNRFHLLTYDFKKNKSFVKFHPFFSPDPLLRTPDEVLFNVRHQDLNGIFGLAVVKNISDSLMDYLYFHSLAGIHEFKVNTKILKLDGGINYKDVKFLKNRNGNVQRGVSVFHSNTNTIFYAEINTKKIGVFRLRDNTEGTYYSFDVELKKGFIVDLSVFSSELWVLVNDKSDIFILKFVISDIIKKVFCYEKSLFELGPCNGTSSVVFCLHITCLIILNFCRYLLKFA